MRPASTCRAAPVKTKNMVGEVLQAVRGGHIKTTGQRIATTGESLKFLMHSSYYVSRVTSGPRPYKKARVPTELSREETSPGFSVRRGAWAKGLYGSPGGHPRIALWESLGGGVGDGPEPML